MRSRAPITGIKGKMFLDKGIVIKWFLWGQLGLIATVPFNHKTTISPVAAPVCATYQSMDQDRASHHLLPHQTVHWNLCALRWWSEVRWRIVLISMFSHSQALMLLLRIAVLGQYRAQHWWSYLERSSWREVYHSLVPHISLVVCFPPHCISQSVLEQVHMEAHGIGWAIHVIPELQTLRTRVGTLRAQETCRVSIGCTVGVDVQVVAIWMSREKHIVVDFNKSYIMLPSFCNRHQHYILSHFLWRWIVVIVTWIKWQIIQNAPAPPVWSVEGPVIRVGVEPRSNVQSKASVTAWLQPQRLPLKLQSRLHTITHNGTFTVTWTWTSHLDLLRQLK